MNLPKTMKICIHKEIFLVQKRKSRTMYKVNNRVLSGLHHIRTLSYQDFVSSKECEASQVLRL